MKNLWLTVELVGHKAVFTVSDDGCGIPAERLPHLFAGLLVSEAPVDANRNNMGIGLSVCSTIVKAHGGEIQAGNRPEGGAFFRFALELEENDYVE
jgi:two-component system sensor histidine kinase KdpD